jgi:hypothetical protein
MKPECVSGEKGEYLKHKINDPITKNKNKITGDLFRGMNKFLKGYQPRGNLEQNESCDLLADSHKNDHYNQLKVQSAGDVRHTEMHTVEPLMTDPSPLKMKWLLQSWKRLISR